MSRRPPVDQHPQITKIEAAIWNKEPYRSIAERFDVSIGALSRHAQKILATPPAASTPAQDVNPVSPPEISPPVAVPYTPSAHGTVMERDDLFDVLSMSFPWAAGEFRPDQTRAQQLRSVQSRLGLAAVRSEALGLVGDWITMSPRLSAHAFARMVNVPVPVIEQWRQARRAADKDELLNTEAADRVARDYAELSDAIAQISVKLSEKGLGARVFSQLTQQKTRLIEQRAKLLERHGLDKITVDQRDDAVKRLQQDVVDMLSPLVELCRGMEAAGISLDDLPRLFEDADDPAPVTPAEPEPEDDEADAETGCMGLTEDVLA